ncbi:GmrSD restriction endonuclease domain-containing protein [Nocardia testacea]|uniref:GmrSD restriction endonuclease domain-containing protein n=1 Tax=Nocardia testacea TaxID=248551 RepID=UPI003A8A50D4
MADSAGTTELSVQGESLQKLYSQFVQGRYLVNRRYQRKLVWSVEEKEKLIDSVLNQLPIPLILLAETVHEGKPRLEVIDGLQRLNAIFSFFENEFSYKGQYFDLETLADTKFKKDRGELKQRGPILDREICLAFTNYPLPISTYRSASGSSVDEVFRRINSSGRYLSLQEIRQAGATADIAQLVRRVSAEVRGDASLTDYVHLSEMPKISITNRDLPYGIRDINIFWVKHGILGREAVRESRDEELVLDIILDIILDPPASSGSEYRNSAYGDSLGRASTSPSVVQPRLAVMGSARVQSRFMETLDLIDTVLEQGGVTFADWAVVQDKNRGVPRQFHAVFIAIDQLLQVENLVPKSNASLLSALKNFWGGDLSIPGGGNWGAERKVSLFNSVKGRLRPYFKPSADVKDVKLQEQALQFEATLRMALTEDSLFELKQGFCRIAGDRAFDDDSFEKVMRTASAMANKGPGTKGIIFFGVADDAADAQAIERFAGISAHTLDDTFYVTGTQHELTEMNRSVDEHYRWLTDRIRSSKLDPEFATNLAQTLKPFRYKEHLIWQLEPEAGTAPVAWGGEFYDRVGPQTEKVAGSAVVTLVRRFGS